MGRGIFERYSPTEFNHFVLIAAIAVCLVRGQVIEASSVLAVERAVGAWQWLKARKTPD